jgi:menaquinone-9 beta-reductase
MADADVVVVGGGPAGCATAISLARAGWRVTLFDRCRFPRDKPCGEYLTPATRPLLVDLGVWDRLQRDGLAAVPEVRLVSPSGRLARYAPSDAGPAGFAIRRLVLDRILLEAAKSAGVDVREGVRVRALVRSGDAVTGISIASDIGPLRARLVVGADGTHSLVARELGLVRPLARLQRVAIVSHWSGVAGPPAIEMRSAGGIVCGVGSLGRGNANVTIVARTDQASRIAGRHREFLCDSIERSFPDVWERLRQAECESVVRAVGCFGHLTRRASAAGALLVGDAAAFVDPFTGEGVYFALQGARIAAKAADAALHAGDVSSRALTAYDRSRRELSRRYLLCGAVQTVVRTPLLMERLVRRCGREPLVLARLMEVLGDLRPPGDALSAAFAARLFR